MARILLGVSGGIAAYKALELARLATKEGHAVRVLMTGDRTLPFRPPRCNPLLSLPEFFVRVRRHALRPLSRLAPLLTTGGPGW